MAKLPDNSSYQLAVYRKYSNYLSYICIENFKSVCNKPRFSKLFIKTGGKMRRLSFSSLYVIVLISVAVKVTAQSNTPSSFPGDPPVGIGTQLTTPSGPLTALHIHFDPALGSWPAIIQLSNGTGTNSNVFGILGLMPPTVTTTYSSLSTGQDLILHENKSGDIILTNFWAAGAITHKTGGSIRLATAGDTSIGHQPADTTLWHHDYERMTIMDNGNVGIDLPPTSTGLDSAVEQLQLGGGRFAPPGYAEAIPGLTFYGGNRFEGLPMRGSGTARVDYRGITFNHYHDAWTGTSSRFAHMGTSAIYFSDKANGMLQMDAFPYDVSRGLNDFSHGVFMELTGQQGLSMWSDEGDSDQHHYLISVLRPGVPPWPATHDKYGLFYHHTPVYIGTDTNALLTPEFTNITGISPSIGDCWMLVVDGAELAKEVFVLGHDWPDFVFDPGYKLPTFAELDAYIKANHHLPGIPSAKAIDTTGVPLGKTQAALTKQVEEMTLYIIQLNKQVEALNARLEDLERKNGR
jgi:hypothetical protein